MPTDYAIWVTYVKRVKNLTVAPPPSPVKADAISPSPYRPPTTDDYLLLLFFSFVFYQDEILYIIVPPPTRLDDFTSKLAEEYSIQYQIIYEWPGGGGAQSHFFEKLLRTRNN